MSRTLHWLLFLIRFVFLQLTTTILDIVQQAQAYKQLRKGANEGSCFSSSKNTGRSNTSSWS